MCLKNHQYIAGFDNWAEPVTPPRTSVFGGVVALISYALVFAYLIVYLLSSNQNEYSYATGIKPFPSITCPEGNCEFTLPPMKCVASSGCFVKAQSGTSKDMQCVFVAKGAAIPESLRKIYYTGDPVEYFSVLSTDGATENFAVSYDLDTVTEYRDPLDITHVEAAPDFGAYNPMPPKIYRGVSIMNMLKTVGIKTDDEAYTWTNSVTTYEQPTVQNIGPCCASSASGAQGTGESPVPAPNNNGAPGPAPAPGPNTGGTGGGGIKNADGSDFTGTQPQCDASDNTGELTANYFLTSLQAATTYTEIVLEDPFDFDLIFGLVGGWLGFVGTFAGLVIFFYKSACPGSGEAEVEVEVTGSIAGTNPAQGTDLKL